MTLARIARAATCVLSLLTAALVSGCVTPPPAGYAFAWGGNESGEIGGGNNAPRAEPIPVSALGRVLHVAAGGAHALAIKPDGTLWAWGDNSVGQLGTGRPESSRRPVPVARPPGARGIATGVSHSLAVWDDGSVWAWGRGTEGQLGNGNAQNSNLPVRVNMREPRGSLQAGATVSQWSPGACGAGGAIPAISSARGPWGKTAPRARCRA